ncbi:unnamed protein product [Oncorhynchus mykiss]|uniref:RING-type domain-containing protein n=1 Tax=Oncorhynchus mykiss TaxID=8022 RepID=A0A060YK28_ONCMY|nr:unnamed protein product [Oncorhynchus mykiss]
MSSMEERGEVGVAAAPGSSGGLGVGAVGAALETVVGGPSMQEEVGFRRGEGLGPDSDPDEPPPKKRMRLPEGESGKLEERLYSVLCCTVCLDLPKASVYQCTNGHLMCAGCFIHLLADSRLKEEQATCPNCRCEITKSLCCRNLAVEKAVSELPTDCPFCLKQFPRSSLERHQKEECQDRYTPHWVTQCKYKRIGCPWKGPFHELPAHEEECCHPTKTGTELMGILGEMDQSHSRELTLYNSIFSLLCYEKIGFTGRLGTHCHTHSTLLPHCQIKLHVFIKPFLHQQISQCCTETQPRTPNSKQCTCRSTVARENSLERQEPRMKPREEPGSEGWPVLLWLCWVEIIRVHGH